MHCFIVGPEADRNEGLARLVERLGFPVAHAPTLAALSGDDRFRAAERPLVLVTDLAERSSAVRLAREEAGRTFVVLVADSLEPDLYRELVRTRAGDWIARENLADELRELVASLQGAGPRRANAKVVSFAPSKGGVGNTTLALESAIHLAGRRKVGARVALLDLNLAGGTAADLLDLEPRFDVQEIASRPERLDEQLLDVFTSRHASGLHVFASSARDGAPDELEPEVVFAFIDILSSRYEVILLDLPLHRLSWTDDLLRGSDAIVVTGGGQVPALRRLTTLLARLDGLGIGRSRVAAAVNQCRVDLLGRFTHRAEIERALAGCRTFFVRRDVDAVSDASNVGNALMELMPNSRVARDIRRLAGWVANATETRSLPTEAPR